MTHSAAFIDPKSIITKWTRANPGNGGIPAHIAEEVRDALVNNITNENVVRQIQHICPGWFVFNGTDRRWFEWDDGRWFGWDNDMCRWTIGDNGLIYAIMYKVGEYWNQILYDAMLACEPDALDILKDAQNFVWTEASERLNNTNSVKRIVGTAKRLMRDDSIIFDNNRRLFGCDNGVWDFDEMVFRPAKLTDYVLTTCGYDYYSLDTSTIAGETAIEVKEVREMLAQTFTDERVRRCAIRVLAAGLTEPIGKCVVFQGGGASGKSTINQLMRATLGGYADCINADMLRPSRILAKTAVMYHRQIEHVRYVYAQETDNVGNREVNSIVRGETLRAHVNNREISATPRLTLVIECCKPFACAPRTRQSPIIIPFTSTFTDSGSHGTHSTSGPVFPKKSITRAWFILHRHRAAMLNILISALAEPLDISELIVT